ncbi:hypothetical protein SKAU_G00071940 [Synaphobranchus kaupii]|uniref:Ion transport domain-containing protein n=1 Tax=Synaphobranchus kaupii TaxID=118154 RepID=A0A9Q1G830_SYNKA|nr:hypothetical protein SKAU_G00071940 [Synaphobranchus kaupii]
MITQNSCYECVIDEDDTTQASVFDLAHQGNAELLGNLLNRYPEYLSIRDCASAGPLHYATSGGSHRVMRLLVNMAGTEELNATDDQGNTPLHWAVQRDDRESCVTLLDLGADPNILNRAVMSPLHLAVSLGHNGLVTLLLSHGGTDADLEGDLGNTPVMMACSTDNCEALCILTAPALFQLKHGAKMCHQNKLGHFAIHAAAFAGAKKAMECILIKGAIEAVKLMISAYNRAEDIINITDGANQTPLHNVREFLSDEDSDGCTPLHYACRLGIAASVQNMLGLKVSPGRKSKDKKSAFHFAAEFGRINTCQRLLETVSASRLLNEGDENGMTPLHLACRGGHTRVVELLLRKGALFNSDYKGWTSLHHAAAEGYTQTMKILLSANIKSLDKTDEDGNTALHLAAKEGHKAAVRLLLTRGAEFTLNNNDSSFLHEAVFHGRQEVANTAVESERCDEAIRAFKPSSSKRCVVMDMIECLPESFKYLLDLCVKESEQDANNHDYWIEYDFQYLQAPIKLLKLAKTDRQTYKFQPLAALNAMVEYNRVELLTHPVCKKYLAMKWNAYGSKAHILNLAIYTVGLLPLSFLIVNMRPECPKNSTSVSMAKTGSDKHEYSNIICMFLVLALNLYAVAKEIVQMVQQRSHYFRDISNGLDWVSATFSILFVVPLLLNVEGSLHWQAGAYAVLASWINFLLYLQRFEHFGIYVVMFGEIMRTLVSIIMLFFFLMLAFALGFYALMINQERFERLDISLMQTFVMMIGLAVGDIAEVQKNATLKRIAMQIDLHTSLEEKLPYWFMKRVDQAKITEYPNRKCKTKANLLYFFQNWEEPSVVRTHFNTDSNLITPVEYELHKQKYRLKEIANVLERQHILLKLIIQKMEITTEADDNDGPELFQRGFGKRVSKRSKWIPLVKAVVKKD